MALQVDDGGGQALRRIIEGMGVDVRLGTASESIDADADGRVGGAAARRTRTTPLPVDVVVFATGVRPRDELAGPAGLRDRPARRRRRRRGVPHRGPRVWAIGEVACIEGRCLGLVAPGYTMAEVVVDRLLGGDGDLPGRRPVDQAQAARGRRRVVRRRLRDDARRARARLLRPGRGVYTKLVVTDDARTLLGGVLVGDASAYASLRPMVGPSSAATRRCGCCPRAPVASGRRPSCRRRRRSARATTSRAGPSATR